MQSVISIIKLQISGCVLSEEAEISFCCACIYEITAVQCKERVSEWDRGERDKEEWKCCNQAK